MSRIISFTNLELEIVRNMWYLEDSRYNDNLNMTKEEIRKYDDAFENIAKKIF